MSELDALHSCLKNLTPRSRQAFIGALREVNRLDHKCIGAEHLLLGIINLEEGIAVESLRSLNVDLNSLRDELVRAVNEEDAALAIAGMNKPITKRLKKIILLSAEEARAMNYNYIGTEHLLLAILHDGESNAARILAERNVDAESLRKKVLAALEPTYTPDSESAKTGVTPPQESNAPFGNLTALNTFGRNLTELAKTGKLDPVIGRQDEIERVIQILCRRTKNNPVLIGEAGVGKTAIVEGLAEKIAAGDVPEILAGKQIFSLDLTLMVAGTKYRGQFEERIKAVLDEVQNSGVAILFIDELHTLVGAGSPEGTMDAANIIKPALSRGELQCIGATTLDEYRKGIEKDAALERRFQSVIVNPPSPEDAVKILMGLKGKYEEHHGVCYTPDAIEAAVKLADRYISGRFLPDKAIDLMDESGARVRIQNMKKAPDLRPLEKQLEEIKQQKDNAITEQKFEEAAELRNQERALKQQIEATLSTWKNETERAKPCITENDIAEVLSKLSGIPVQQMESGETGRLLNMENDLAQTVIGQDDAVSSIARSLRRSRANLKDPARPIGSFMFLGPTGVGKTLLAKALAEFMFGSADALIQVDMSEYMEKFNVSRLVGSPPGYVGHGDGGELTEKVRRHPYSVVLFDEIEKAHPDVMHMFLQILEEGKLTDTLGRRIDFRNTVVIMTSNVGAEVLAKGGGALGFAGSEVEKNQKSGDRLLEIAKKRFKPEFINRLDEVVVFRKLVREDLEKIITLEVNKLAKRLEEAGQKLTVEPEVIRYLLDQDVQAEYGARPLRRMVERMIEDPLSDVILRGTFRKGEGIRAVLDNNKILFLPAEKDA